MLYVKINLYLLQSSVTSVVFGGSGISLICQICIYFSLIIYNIIIYIININIIYIIIILRKVSVR